MLSEGIVALLHLLCYAQPRQSQQGIYKTDLAWSHKSIPNFNHIKQKKKFQITFQ